MTRKHPAGVLAPHLFRYRGVLITAAILALLEAAVALPVPLVIRHLLDHVLKYEPQDEAEISRVLGQLVWLFAALLVLALLRGIFTYFRRLVSERAGQHIVHDLRLDLLRRLERLSLSYLRKRSVGRFMPRFLSDLRAVYRFLTRGIFQALTDGLLIVLVLGALLWMDARLTLALLFVMGIYVLILKRLSPHVREASRKARRETIRLSGDLHSLLTSMPLVKSYNLESQQTQRLDRRSKRLRDRLVRGIQLGAVMLASGRALVAASGALILWLTSREVVLGRMSLGDMVAFYTFLAFIFGPLRRLAPMNETYQRAHVSLDKLATFQDRTAVAVEAQGGKPIEISEGRIELRGVRYGYSPDQPILDGVDLEVRPGTILGLAGPNGAGKSTLLGLLLRWEDPWEGLVLIDGQDLKEVAPASLRAQVGLVLQDPVLMKGTVGENILLGRMEATQSEVEEAARAVGLLTPGSRLGLSSPVGEGGRRLSVGEKQRVALARALVRRPRILLLDEATAALEEAAGRGLVDLIRSVGFVRTAVVVSHRSDALSRADRVVTLEKGQIVEGDRDGRTDEEDRQAADGETHRGGSASSESPR